MKPRRVVVVDDDPMCLAMLEKAIESFGCLVTAAASGEIALKILKDQGADVLVTDLLMPGICGVVLAKCAREILPLIKVIICTGACPEVVGAVEENFTVMPKPIILDQLKALVKGGNERRN